MRRVNTDELDGPTPPRVAGDVDLGGQLNQLLAGLKELQTMQKTLTSVEKDIANMWTRINRAEQKGDKAQQYEKDHNEHHRQLAAMASKKDTARDEAIALAVSASKKDMTDALVAHTAQVSEMMKSHMEITMQAIATLQAAVQEIAGKEIAVNVSPGEQSVVLQADPAERRYKINRNQNGLIDEIVESKA